MSSTAKPSRRNSGFHASSTSGPAGACAARYPASRSAEPTGTVDLPTTSAGPVRCGASEASAESTYDMSQAYSPCFCGVFTQRKCTSPKAPASAKSVVKRSRPLDPSIPSTCRRSSSSRPGFVHRDLAAPEHVDLLRHHVQAEYLEPQLRHGRRVGRAEIAGADHGDLDEAMHLPEVYGGRAGPSITGALITLSSSSPIHQTRAPLKFVLLNSS
ncbi:hypothetical protein SFUMM280S_03169 [Streptomyces fumanus]